MLFKNASHWQKDFYDSDILNLTFNERFLCNEQQLFFIISKSHAKTRVC